MDEGKSFESGGLEEDLRRVGSLHDFYERIGQEEEIFTRSGASLGSGVEYVKTLSDLAEDIGRNRDTIDALDENSPAFKAAFEGVTSNNGIKECFVRLLRKELMMEDQTSQGSDDFFNSETWKSVEIEGEFNATKDLQEFYAVLKKQGEVKAKDRHSLGTGEEYMHELEEIALEAMKDPLTLLDPQKEESKQFMRRVTSTWNMRENFFRHLRAQAGL